MKSKIFISIIYIIISCVISISLAAGIVYLLDIQSEMAAMIIGISMGTLIPNFTTNIILQKYLK